VDENGRRTMGLDIYWIGLLILAPCTALVLGRNFVLRPFMSQHDEKQEPTMYNLELENEAKKFRRTFLQVYLLVMGSEWLQVSWKNGRTERTPSNTRDR
jgi:hypothetical protein